MLENHENGNWCELPGDAFPTFPNNLTANAGVDGNSFGCPLSQASQAENEFSFFDDACEGNQSCDLFMDYSLPEFGNFDDVDRMFRSCDSTFGLGTSEELGWFSSNATGLHEPCSSINGSGMSDQSFGNSHMGNLWGPENSCVPTQPLSYQVGVIFPDERRVEENLPSGHQFEDHIEMDGMSLKGRVELNDGSEEASSFHQLQHVMEGIDLKTKLCIRDSLYRLARSAEQRHRHPNVNEDSQESRCVGYMDMERNTNPIDRSIAHLLFHQH